MALKWTQGENVKKRNLIVVIYGPPSVGKTSLALTASKPMLLDADRGVARASTRVGKAIVEVNSWEDIREPEPADFSEFDTVIVDTAGGALDFMSAYIIRNDPKRGAGGTLDLRGYGVLKAMFSAWLGKLRACGVDIVLVAHAAEEQRGDDMVDRIYAAGSSKQEIYQQADLIGRLYPDEEGGRLLSFDPSSGSFGKNVGLAARKVVDPIYAPGQLAEVITEARVRINDMLMDNQEEAARLQTLHTFVQGLKTPEELTDAARRMRNPEAPAPDVDKRLLWERAKALGFIFDDQTTAFFATEQERDAARAAGGTEALKAEQAAQDTDQAPAADTEQRRASESDDLKLERAWLQKQLDAGGLSENAMSAIKQTLEDPDLKIEDAVSLRKSIVEARDAQTAAAQA